MSTLNQLLRTVTDKTSVTDAAGTAERAFLVRAYNEGVRQLLLDTRCQVEPITIALTAGDSEYDLTSYNILAVVDYVNTDDNRSSLWVAPTSEVLARRLWGSQGAARRFTVLGTDLMIVNPTPAEDGEFTFYAVVQPTELTTDDGETDLADQIPAFAQKGVEAWMCIEASEKVKDFQGVQYYTARYKEECVKTRKRMRQMAGRYLPGSPVPGYPGDGGRFADNSFDDGR